MTYKEYFYTVIKPRLVEMAIDGTLPLDMNELCFENFPEVKENRIVWGWSIEDVHTRAKMHDLELNDKDAEEILEIFEHRGDASVCISWDTMDYAIHEWLHIKSINPAG
jgi:hypothetical protein